MKQLLAGAFLVASLASSAVMAETIVYSSNSVIGIPTQYVVASPVVVSTPVVRTTSYVVSNPVVVQSSPVIYTSGTYCNSSPVVTTYYSY